MVDTSRHRVQWSLARFLFWVCSILRTDVTGIAGALIFFVKVQVFLSLQMFFSQWSCCDMYLLVCDYGSD